MTGLDDLRNSGISTAEAVTRIRAAMGVPEAGLVQGALPEAEEGSEAVTKLDAIDPTGDPDGAHSEADRILLSAAPPEVRAAYARLVARASWWATA